ncbi:MAG: tannase/feruloyl esterase family alpha/beta hydrolase [Ponticaulis sp.]|nr:tannase/feruloyl esterase family alpha/beta hydrolase [Ponticaulis sp.]
MKRTSLMQRVCLPVLVLGLTAAAGCSVEEQTDPAHSSEIAGPNVVKQTCSELAGLALDNTEISSASVVTAGSFAPPPSPMERPADYASMPDYCRVTGSIKPTPQSDIQFEAWLPLDESWNGRFMQVGNGGAAGSFMYASMVEPLKRGYAVVHTDTGHKGTAGDFTWAMGEPEKLVDYQYRAVHELTLKGKAITEARYGKAPEQSIWYGCSTGGRQGLKEAQRYPEDYDAIVAGAPANNWAPLQLLSIHIMNNLGEGGLPATKLGLLKSASIAACDGDDGLEDGMIASPETCGFDPEVLACEAGDASESCLTETEVAAAQRLYAGVVTSDGTTVFPGTGFGSETDWAIYTTPFFRIGTSYMRNVVLEDPNWDPATLDVDSDLALLQADDQGVISAMEPDMSPFVDAGGKLLLYHGLADGIISYGNTMRYYDSVVETMDADAVSESIQFFTVPGMGHCGGGDGASQVDWLSAMEGWLETGEKPAELVASKPGEDGYTRPVCAYPKVVTYSGEGDASDAANFTCEVP